MQLCRHHAPLNCLTHKAQPFIWTPECQASFDMLHSRLSNTPIVQLPDPNKLYLLFTAASKFCYSGVLTQAPTNDSNEALMKILTCEAPLKVLNLKTQDLQLESNVIHPVAYISDIFSQSQCGWSRITKECFSVFYVNKQMFLYLQNTNLLCSDHKPVLKIFTGHTDNDKCNTWDLEATAIPRRDKVLYIKGIANVLADSVSRIRVVGLYHDIDLRTTNRNSVCHLSPYLLLSQP